MEISQNFRETNVFTMMRDARVLISRNILAGNLSNQVLRSFTMREFEQKIDCLAFVLKHFALCRMLFENCLWPKKASRSIGDWTMSWNYLWDNKWDERGGGEAVFSPFLPCLNKRIPLLQSLKPHLSVSLQTVTDFYKWSTKRNSRLTRFFCGLLHCISKFAKSKIHTYFAFQKTAVCLQYWYGRNI